MLEGISSSSLKVEEESGAALAFGPCLTRYSKGRQSSNVGHVIIRKAFIFGGGVYFTRTITLRIERPFEVGALCPYTMISYGI